MTVTDAGRRPTAAEPAGQPATAHPTRPARAGSALTPQGLLSLQRTAGNQAVRRVAATHRPDTAGGDGVIRRAMDYDGRRLATLTSVKGKLVNSTLNTIVSTYGRYMTAVSRRTGSLVEVNLLTELKTQIGQWMAQRAGEKGGLSKSQAVKQQTLLALERAVDKELPLARERVHREKALKDLGLAPEYVAELTAADVAHLYQADAALARGDVARADAALTALKASAGDGPVNLIKSSLMSRHLGKVNPELSKAVRDPKYKLKDKAQIAEGARKVQDLGNDRRKELVDLTDKYKGGQPPAGMDPAEWSKIQVKIGEGAYHIPVLGDLKAAADARKTDAKKAELLGKMTQEEVAAVLGYSTSMYGKFNGPLRTAAANLPTDQASLTKLAISGLNKLKPYTGEVYRHTGNFAGYRQLNRVGGVVVDIGFVSSARVQQGCVSGAEQHEVLEVVKSKSGRDISKISVFEGEAEVLFRPGVKFRVTRVAERRGGDWPDDETRKYAKQTVYEKDLQLVVYKSEV